MSRDYRRNPCVGDKATQKVGKKTFKVTRIRHHVDSTDISYMNVKNVATGREKVIVHWEWMTQFVDHEGPF